MKLNPSPLEFINQQHMIRYFNVNGNGKNLKMSIKIEDQQPWNPEKRTNTNKQ
jgi:hypothetical protein